jgi:hypothetical protein
MPADDFPSPLFHYCSAQTFWLLLQRQVVWLSSILNMNDSAELKWGQRIIDEEFRRRDRR